MIFHLIQIWCSWEYTSKRNKIKKHLIKIQKNAKHCVQMVNSVYRQKVRTCQVKCYLIYNTILYSTVQYNTTQHNTILPCNTIHCTSIQCNAIQYKWFVIPSNKGQELTKSGTISLIALNDKSNITKFERRSSEDICSTWLS